MIPLESKVSRLAAVHKQIELINVSAVIIAYTWTFPGYTNNFIWVIWLSSILWNGPIFCKEQLSHKPDLAFFQAPRKTSTQYNKRWEEGNAGKTLKSSANSWEIGPLLFFSLSFINLSLFASLSPGGFLSHVYILRNIRNFSSFNCMKMSLQSVMNVSRQNNVDLQASFSLQLSGFKKTFCRPGQHYQAKTGDLLCPIHFAARLFICRWHYQCNAVNFSQSQPRKISFTVTSCLEQLFVCYLHLIRPETLDL